MSSATLVSIIPWDIREEKAGIHPSRYNIPACKDQNRPQVLVIGDGLHYVYLDGDRGQMPIKTPAYDLAKSIVYDFASSVMEYTEDAAPGLFALDGAVSLSEVIKGSASELSIAQARQVNWFKRLVSVADDDWNRYHKHIVISDMQRIAARELGYKRDWTELSQMAAQKKCPSCFADVHPEAVVCGMCKYVLNAEKHKQMQFANAQV